MVEGRRSGEDRRKKQMGGDLNERADSERRVLCKFHIQFIKVLEKIPIFKGLNVNQFKTIINICSKHFYKNGETLFFEGDNSYEMYILIKGELVIKSLEGKVFSRIKPVGIVGEMGIFTGESRSASVEAATDCILLIIQKRELVRLFEKDCFLAVHILMNVIKDLSHKLRINNVIIEELHQLALPGDFSKILSKTLEEND